MMPSSRSVLAAGLAALFLLSGSAAAEPALPEPAVPIHNRLASVHALIACTHGHTTLISGHRGGNAPGWPESALETFAHTLSQAPMLLETDVRTTKDGVLMLMHDDSVDRTTTGTGKVADLTWAELQKLQLKDDDRKLTPYRIPRLDAVLDWMRGRGLLVLDMKEGAETAAVAHAIEAARAQPYTAVVAYTIAQANAFQAIDKNISIFYPLEKPETLTDLKVGGVDLSGIIAWTGVDAPQPELWRQLRQNHVPIAFGTLFWADYAMGMTGNTRHYVDLARLHVDVLPSDTPVRAYRAIDPHFGEAAALRRCGAVGGPTRVTARMK